MHHVSSSCLSLVALSLSSGCSAHGILSDVCAASRVQTHQISIFTGPGQSSQSSVRQFIPGSILPWSQKYYVESTHYSVSLGARLHRIPFAGARCDEAAGNTTAAVTPVATAKPETAAPLANSLQQQAQDAPAAVPPAQGGCGVGCGTGGCGAAAPRPLRITRRLLPPQPPATMGVVAAVAAERLPQQTVTVRMLPCRPVVVAHAEAVTASSDAH